MNQHTESKLRGLLRQARRSRYWNRGVALATCGVMLVTVVAMTLPAVSMETAPQCGLEEHVHGPECYTEKQVLVCPMQDTDDPEFLATGVHVHGPECYEQRKTLICTLEESEGHTHTDTCYETVMVPGCGLEEGEIHTHGEACYTDEPVLTCTVPEAPAHRHNEECYSIEQVLVCTQDHDHGPDCYEEQKTLICGLEETEGHTHSEACYTHERKLTCPLEEGVPHTHTESCMHPEQKLICTLEETEGHSHTEDCYQVEDVLICTQPGVVAHSHGPDCYVTEQELTCTILEHVHTDACRSQSDDEADVETAQLWEQSVSGVTLTGDWAQDLVHIAASQVGYTESQANFRMNEAGRKMGYTRYGDWFGSPYGHWCVMFVSFCMHYAGIPDDVLGSSSNTDNFAFLFRDKGVYTKDKTYTPAVGDVIFFNAEQTGPIDHVGIVEELIYAAVPQGEEPKLMEIHTIEGNAEDAVRRKSYAPDDPEIYAYGRISQAQALYGVPVEEEPQDPVLTYEDELLTLTVNFTGLPEPLPETARLSLRPITEENDPATLESAAFTAGELVEENRMLSGLSVFSLQLMDGDVPLSLPAGVSAQVQLRFTGPLFPETDVRPADLHTLVLSGLTEPAAPASEEAVTYATEPAPITPQEVEATYGGAEQGVTALDFTTDSLTSFAVLYTTETKTGNFWKQVRSLDALQPGETYILVSVEGGFALTDNLNSPNSPNYTAVQLQPVKANPDYFTAEVPEAARWTYKDLGGPTFSHRIGESVLDKKTTYVNPAVEKTLNELPELLPDPNIQPLTSSEQVFTEEKTVLTLGSGAAPGTITLSNDGMYLSVYAMNSEIEEKDDYHLPLGIGNDQKFRGADKGTTYDHLYYFWKAHTDELQIYQLVNASLSVPADAVAGSGSGLPGSAQKPQYGPYVPTSDQLVGEVTVGGITGQYASDPATSQLEAQFGNGTHGGTDFMNNQSENGKLLMDKSVTYGRDDYDVFNRYEDGSFGVTLSALGQDFVVDATESTVPIDVLFILDMSNSMNETDPGQAENRGQILVNSMNKTIANLMESNPENRVCAVGFNSSSYELLPLGRYEPDSQGRYFRWQSGPINPDSGKPAGQIVPTGPNGDIGSPVTFAGGTFTQMGIAQGYALMSRNHETTYTVEVGGEHITRPRKPVVILASDGGPTHCTSAYMDVLRNPYYGDGAPVIHNSKGQQGYYTILSANYYKRMVGIHYHNPATMYTVAFGMEENDFSLAGVTVTTNHYRATVMNPTQANINALLQSPTQYASQVEKALYDLLQGGYSAPGMVAGAHHDINPRLGHPHVLVPILRQNPYRGNYAYADKAYLGNTGNDGLDAAFADIVERNSVYDYSYETQNGEPIVLTDPIGEGMALQSDPVLRINGVNYAPDSSEEKQGVRTYTYPKGTVPLDPHSGRTAELSDFTVTVETDAQGLQTVRLSIAPKALPTYTADATTSFFYEALPVRLIYQVGLTEQAQADIAAMPGGTTLTYTTNRYEGQGAEGSLNPSLKNKYYLDTDRTETRNKAANPTATAGTSLTIEENGERIRYNLGNNGRLTFSKEKPPVMLVVQKQWQNFDGTELTENLPPEVRGRLYRTYKSKVGRPKQEPVAEFVLTAETGWRAEFTAEDLQEKENRNYQYYVDELSVPGFTVSYSGDGVAASGPDSPILITNRYKYSDVELPETGGPGTAGFTVLGAGLMLGSILYLCASRRKNRRGYGR